MADRRVLPEDPRLVRASALAGDRRTAAPWPPKGRLVELIGGFDAAVTTTAVAAIVRAQRAGEITAWLEWCAPRAAAAGANGAGSDPDGERRAGAAPTASLDPAANDGDPAASAAADGLLFPPDLAANGVDLQALVVVRVPLAATAQSARRGADRREASRSRSGSRNGGGSGRHELPKAAELLLRSGAFDLVVADLRPLPPPPGAWLGRLQVLARTHQTSVLLLSDAKLPLEAGSTSTLRVSPLRRRGERPGTFVVESRIVRDKLHQATAPDVVLRHGPTGLV